MLWSYAIMCSSECSCCFFFFFKQKTAYEMRISDWSSDVCSSDLMSCAARSPTSCITRAPASFTEGLLQRRAPIVAVEAAEELHQLDDQQNGRASCRERVGKYV